MHTSDLTYPHLSDLQTSQIGETQRTNVDRGETLYWAIGWMDIILTITEEICHLGWRSSGINYKVIRWFQTLTTTKLSQLVSLLLSLIYYIDIPGYYRGYYTPLHKFINLKSISKHLKTNSLFSCVFEYECDKTSFHKFITDEWKNDQYLSEL